MFPEVSKECVKDPVDLRVTIHFSASEELSSTGSQIQPRSQRRSHPSYVPSPCLDATCAILIHVIGLVFRASACLRRYDLQSHAHRMCAHGPICVSRSLGRGRASRHRCEVPGIAQNRARRCKSQLLCPAHFWTDPRRVRLRATLESVVLILTTAVALAGQMYAPAGWARFMNETYPHLVQIVNGESQGNSNDSLTRRSEGIARRSQCVISGFYLPVYLLKLPSHDSQATQAYSIERLPVIQHTCDHLWGRHRPARCDDGGAVQGHHRHSTQHLAHV